MSTSKTVIAVIFALAAAFAVITLTVSCCRTKTKDSSDISESVNSYLIKEYEGKIAVFESSGAKPVWVIDSPRVRDLPVYDRALLSVGIPIKSAAELGSIIEDYDS